MSVSSMTNVAFARRRDVPPLDEAPATAAAIGEAAGGAEVPKSALASRMQAIAIYIPTEVLTLYVAVLAALQEPTSPAGRIQEWVAFGSFLVLTPVIVWLGYAGKVRGANKPLPLRPRKWPLWEMFSATIAYTAWAFALPKTPFQGIDWYSSALAGVLVLMVTTFLGLLAPIVAGTLEP